MVDGKAQYRMMGEGDLPIHEMLDALVDMGYDGYISLEWVKRWAQELSDAGVVFPQSVSYTHLDVYKRQWLPCSARPTVWPLHTWTSWLLSGALPISPCSSPPVSYTHLDVYKRQVFDEAQQNFYKETDYENAQARMETWFEENTGWTPQG